MPSSTSKTSALASSPLAVALSALTATALLALFFLRLWLVGARNVNWDEFNFVRSVDDAAHGALRGVMLAGPAHLFRFAAGVRDGIDRVLVVRAVAFALSLAAAGAFVRLLTALTRDRLVACVGVVWWWSCSLVLHHGSSARFDPLLVSFLLIAAAIASSSSSSSSSSSWAQIAAGAAALALAAWTSPKIVLFAGAWLGVFVVVPWRRALAISAFAAMLTVFFYGLNLLWQAPPSTSASLAPSTPTETLSQTLRAIGAFPRKTAFLDTWRHDTVLWGLIVVGVVGCCVLAAIVPRARRAALFALCAATPLLSLSFYQNAFSYFYVCLIPLAVVAPVVVAAALRARFPRATAAVLAASVAALAPVVVSYARLNAAPAVDDQRALVAGVNQIFPPSAAVSYLDRCAMVAEHRSVGLFMSTWTLRRYRAQKTPIYRRLLREEHPQFLIANVRGLAPKSTAVRGRYALLPDDQAALRAAFLPYWGPVYVAGFVVDDENALGVDVDVLIAGAYVADHDFSLDGVPHQAGVHVVGITPGVHKFGVSSRTTFRTALAGPPPSQKPPTADALFWPLMPRRHDAADDDDDGDDTDEKTAVKTPQQPLLRSPRGE